MKLTGETKVLIAFLVIIGLGGGTLALLSKLQNTDTPPPPAPTPPPALSAAEIDTLYGKSRNKKGEASAALTFIEFGDFQCPSCRRAFNRTIAKIEADKSFPTHKFAFFNLPLQMHERAIPAAVAAEAAGKQGKFWPMYDALFADASEGLDDKKILEAATKAGLNLDQFKSDIKTDAPLKKLVEDDKSVATSQGINTTPTFFIRDSKGNTAVLAGAGNLERFKADLQDGVIGNNPVPAPSDPTAAGSILLSIGGKTESR